MGGNDKETLQILVQKLTQRGDDAEELAFWEQIFDDLEPDEQERLFEILSEELKRLEALKP